MANVDAPFGLRPVKHLNGMPWNGQTMRCMVPSGTAVNLYVGDAVIRGTTADATGYCPTVTVAVMGDAAQIFGVITSFEPDVTDSTKVYRTASTNRYCQVCIDPDVIYQIQDSGGAAGTVAIGIAGVGLNANLIQTHLGSTVSGVSQMELNADTVAADSSFQLLILNAAPLSNNDATIARAVWEVIISQHQLRTFVTAHGILGS